MLLYEHARNKSGASLPYFRVYDVQDWVPVLRQTVLVEFNSLWRLELGAELGKFFVCLGVTFEEGVLRIAELLGVRAERIVVKEGAVRLHFEELRISALVSDRREVTVVEHEPTLCPRRTAGIVFGLLAVGPDLLGAVSVLGLLGTDTAPVLVGASERVCTGKSNNLFIIQTHAVEHLAQVTIRGRVLGWSRAAGSPELAVGSGIAVRQVAFWAAHDGVRGVDASVPVCVDRARSKRQRKNGSKVTSTVQTNRS